MPFTRKRKTADENANVVSEMINELITDADTAETLVDALPEKTKQSALDFLNDLESYINSPAYAEHLRKRGYNDNAIAERRRLALRGITDVMATDDNLRSFAVVFASAPPEELRQRELGAPQEAQTAKEWYRSYSSLLEATVLYETAEKRKIEANSDLVDKLLIGTDYAFGHTSRRSGVFINYVTTREILSATLRAIEDTAQEAVSRGKIQNTREIVSELSGNVELQRRLAEEVLVNTGIAEWENPQTKQRLKVGIRTKTGEKVVSKTTRNVTDIVVGVVSPKNVDDATAKLRGNILWGVWSMLNATRSADAKQAVEYGAVPFSDTAKKTLNYSYQFIYSQRFGGSEGRLLLPHDPLTVRDVWETAGTLGQIRVIKNPDSPHLNLEHLRNVFVPLGFNIDFDEATNRYTVTPIEEVWAHIAKDEKELRLYRSFAKEVVPTTEPPVLSLFSALPPDVEAQIQELQRTLPPESEIRVSSAFAESFPVFKSEAGTTVWQPLRKTTTHLSVKQLQGVIANAIAKHLNELYDVSRLFTLGADVIPDTGATRYWIGFNPAQAEEIRKRYGFNPMDMAVFENNGATVIRNENGELTEVRFYEDEANRLFAHERTDPKAKNVMKNFSQFIQKAITNNPKLQSGFAPALLETYTTADETYRQNIQTLRQQMETELQTQLQTQPPAEVKPKSTLKRRLKTMLSSPKGEPYSQTFQPQCWVAYRNATRNMGAIKLPNLP